MRKPPRLCLTLAAAATLALACTAAPASAGQNGSNNDAAHRCNHGKYVNLQTSSGGAFATEEACVSYAAHGGTLFAPTATASPIVIDGHPGAQFNWSGLHPLELVHAVGNITLDGNPFVPVDYVLQSDANGSGGQGFFISNVSADDPFCADLGLTLTLTDADGVHTSASTPYGCTSTASAARARSTGNTRTVTLTVHGR